MDAAEQARHQCLLQSGIFRQHPADVDFDDIRQNLIDLNHCEDVIAQAAEAVSSAEHRVGAIRILLCQKALPLSFPPDAVLRGFPPNPRLMRYEITDESDSLDDVVSEADDEELI